MTRAEPPAAPLMGVFAIDWQQTETDAAQGLAPDWLRVGASWRWSGTPLRLDAAAAVMRLGPAQASPDIHPRARAIAARLGCTVLDRTDNHIDRSAPAMGLALTDGARIYHARLVQTARGWVVVFEGFLPPPGQELFIMDKAVTTNPAPQPRQEVICFTDDTVIATANGPRPIDQLQPGDLVQTLDNGLQPVLWVGRSRLSGLALQRFPHLRPIRLRRGALGTGEPDEDLRVSPAHRLLVRGARARALFGEDEVLACARDLVDHQAIAPDLAQHGLSYIHLLLESHQIIFANGVPSESFHPAFAPAASLRQHRRALHQVMPDLCDTPESYGPPARRCLNMAESALLAA